MNQDPEHLRLLSIFHYVVAALVCLVVAGLACMFTPFGTVLGVFTILVLVRPSVKELFGAA